MGRTGRSLSSAATNVGCRSIAANGVWLVAPELRPPNWPSLGLREPFAITEEPACVDSRPDPVPESAPVSLDRSYPDAQVSTIDYLRTIIWPALDAGGRNFGASLEVINAARVLFGCMFTKQPDDLSTLCNCPVAFAVQCLAVYKRGGLINDDNTTVRLGITEENVVDDQLPDLEFWLNAMAGVGQIQLVLPGVFASPEWVSG